MPNRPHKPWHRWLGILLTDLFVGRPWSVAIEEELSLRSQRLDILIVERRDEVGARPDPNAWNDLPDGFDNLAAHNLLSYKSAAEPFNAWALEELIGHYVTYRKLASLRAARAADRAGCLSEAPAQRSLGNVRARRRARPLRLDPLPSAQPHRRLLA
jgi:hypothetical protein